VTFTIGRQELNDPDVWPTSGQSVSLSGDRQAASVAASVVERENLRWMEGTIQPVVWDEDTTKTGFYRVTGVSVETTEVSLSSGHYRWGVGLEPIPHHRAAEIEASCRGADRTNKPATTPIPWYAIPPGYVAVNHATGSITTANRTGPGGTAFAMFGTGFYSRFARWTIPASSFLTMAPRVQFSGVTVVGRQSTLSPLTVTLDNGIVRVAMATGSNTLTVTLPGSTPANWGTPFAVDLGWFDGISTFTVLDPDAFYAARVTRDDAQVCSVRWSWYNAGFIVHVDVSLRRGSAFAEIVMSQEGAYTDRQFGIQESTCNTSSNIRALRSGATEGNYRWLACDPPATQDTGLGLMYATTGADQVRLGVGAVLGGASAASNNAAADLRDQFFAAQQITERFSGVRQ
jgi:hypothetical protein